MNGVARFNQSHSTLNCFLKHALRSGNHPARKKGAVELSAFHGTQGRRIISGSPEVEFRFRFQPREPHCFIRIFMRAGSGKLQGRRNFSAFFGKVQPFESDCTRSYCKAFDRRLRRRSNMQKAMLRNRKRRGARCGAIGSSPACQVNNSIWAGGCARCASMPLARR